MKSFAIYFWLLAAAPAFAAGPDPGLQKLKSVESPERDLTAEFFFRDADSKRQIWLRTPTSATQAELLCEYERDADVLFSPDEHWIAVNDHIGSDVSEVRLFKQLGGLKYAEEEKAAVTEKAWRFLANRYELPTVPKLDHMYSQVVRWAPDSRAFLVVLDGHTDINQHVDSWSCVYDLTSLQPSLELSLMNRNAVHVAGKILAERGVTPNQASLAREAGSNRCDPPPVTTAEQAVCLARLDIEGTSLGADWKPLKAEAFRHDESCWVVEFRDTRPGVLGGGGQVTVDVNSGKVTKRRGDQ